VPIQTNIKFGIFLKAIQLCARSKGLYCSIIPKSGSARRIELFAKPTDKIPVVFWVVHEDKYVWSGDLKKACGQLDITTKDFKKIVNSL